MNVTVAMAIAMAENTLLRFTVVPGPMGPKKKKAWGPKNRRNKKKRKNMLQQNADFGRLSRFPFVFCLLGPFF